MEEEWTKIEDLQNYYGSAYTKMDIDSLKKIYMEIFKDNNIEYKFEDGENYISKAHKGKFDKRDFLNVYIKKNDLKKAKELIKQLSYNAQKTQKAQVEEYTTQDTIIINKISRYFIIGTMIAAFILEISLLINAICENTFVLDTLIILVLFWIGQAIVLIKNLKKR